MGFQLVGSPAIFTGNFTNGMGGCGYPVSFPDRFRITVEDGRITIFQFSTGDSVTGIIKMDRTFTARQDDPPESYEGHLTPDGLSVVIKFYFYTNSFGCTTTYNVTFTRR